MSALILVGIGLLGGIGAVGRFLLDGAVSRRTAGSFPLGTLAVNLSGALTLGVIAGIGTGEQLTHLLATGLLGAYTTFSTWALESERLAEDGELGRGIANFVLSLLLGVSLCWLGIQIGAAL
jgi:fluoride exporter